MRICFISFVTLILIFDCFSSGFKHRLAAIRKRRSFSRLNFVSFGEYKSIKRNGYVYGFSEKSTSISICPQVKVRNKFGLKSLRSLENFIIYTIKRCKRARQGHTCFWSKLLNTMALSKQDQIDGITINSEELSLCYIFISCKFTKGTLSICPNPCGRQPCKDISHTGSNVCKTTKNGLFTTNFKCDCAITYEWDSFSHTCTKIDLCRSKSTYPCHALNTELCTMKDAHFACQCREHSMGNTCKEKRNACISNYKSEFPPGNKACGNGGKCVPTIATNQYRCECDDRHSDNEQNGYPDCLKEKSLCASILCVHGYCHASIENTVARCVCDAGYRGKFCDAEISKWNPWHPWGPCVPKCGNPRNRARKRTCSVPDPPCSGSKLAHQSCSPRICKVKGVWLDWESWQKCSSSCGDGRQTRKRKCYYDTPDGVAGHGSPCKGPQSLSQPCQTKPCFLPSKINKKQIQIQEVGGNWETWSVWSLCSVDCGIGSKYRHRKCLQSNGHCIGKSCLKEKCLKKCPKGKSSFGQWSRWSTCVRGKATSYRKRSCLKGLNCFGPTRQKSECINNECMSPNRMQCKSELNEKLEEEQEKNISFKNNYILIGSIVGILFLILLIIVSCMCVKIQRKSKSEDLNFVKEKRRKASLEILKSGTKRAKKAKDSKNKKAKKQEETIS